MRRSSYLLGQGSHDAEEQRHSISSGSLCRKIDHSSDLSQHVRKKMPIAIEWVSAAMAVHTRTSSRDGSCHVHVQPLPASTQVVLKRARQ